MCKTETLTCSKCIPATEHQMRCNALHFIMCLKVYPNPKGECPHGAVCTNRLETGD